MCYACMCRSPEGGALSELPLALNSRICMQLFAGELASAGLLVEEIAAVTAATGSRLAPFECARAARVAGS